MFRSTRFISSSLVQVRHASTKPEKFLQTIVLSNGATYTVRTSSPTRSQIRLTKDTRNHPLWNPAILKEGVTDESEQLTKFQKRFGDLDLADISWIESDEAVSASMKKAAAAGDSLRLPASGGDLYKARILLTSLMDLKKMDSSNRNYHAITKNNSVAYTKSVGQWQYRQRLLCDSDNDSNESSYCSPSASSVLPQQIGGYLSWVSGSWFSPSKRKKEKKKRNG
ncbi:MAG: hypothetical protein EXX96DRAFT_651334 [Benjaminiella poitrasii]|nr:MAG: hypothetical protein EXX96DRAFT_651334 [Benjaminiella poitrasii]